MNYRGRMMAAARSVLARKGIVLGKAPLPNRLDHALTRVLSAYEIDCVLDVGANRGQFAGFLRERCAWKGLIHSFEPVHSTFIELDLAMGDDPAWRGSEMALGSKSGTTRIHHFPDSPWLDSVLPPSEYGRRRLGGLDSRSDEEVVALERLDAVIDTSVPSSARAILLKVDAQGSDLEVLRGAQGCLRRISAVLLELSAIAVYEGLPPLGTSIQEVMTLGFDPVGFFPVSRDPDLRVVEFDSLFVRRP